MNSNTFVVNNAMLLGLGGLS